MNPTSPQPETAEPFYDDYDDGFDQPLATARRRYKFLSPVTAALMALILGGVGFFVGVRVEKSKVGSTGGGASAFARAFTGGSSSSASGASGAGGTSRASAFGGGAGGFAALFGRGAGTAGSVTAIDGNTIYVKETSGNTIKVKLTPSTTVTKTETVSKKRIFPGDQVTISGPSGSGGTVTATAVTDSGASSTAGAAGSTGASSTAATGSGSTSASSAVSSLFGGR